MSRFNSSLLIPKRSNFKARGSISASLSKFNIALSERKADGRANARRPQCFLALSDGNIRVCGQAQKCHRLIPKSRAARDPARSAALPRSPKTTTRPGSSSSVRQDLPISSSRPEAGLVEIAHGGSVSLTEKGQQHGATLSAPFHRVGRHRTFGARKSRPVQLSCA